MWNRWQQNTFRVRTAQIHYNNECLEYVFQKPFEWYFQYFRKACLLAYRMCYSISIYTCLCTLWRGKRLISIHAVWLRDTRTDGRILNGLINLLIKLKRAISQVKKWIVFRHFNLTIYNRVFYCINYMRLASKIVKLELVVICILSIQA